ncbi:hypothetical protein CRE_18112 [Caenorhabditis remanei]|uniref:DUF38 domain-containing protein n=1 Tax=Caenorhabditis remanei TaxID=31234 RepID=E3N351_CAERE|nr:hypothetical protein CRE_18112 [Caenorhabditis remanei]
MPPNHLSYPSLKCVLENLEAIKRFHITARTPSLQKIDKLVPIRFENLYMTGTELTINQLSIVFQPDMKIIDYYLVSRSKILLNQLDSNDGRQGLSFNLKLRVNCLHIRNKNHLEEAIQLIHPDSFPLKAVKTALNTATTSDHPIIKSARTLILSTTRPPFYRPPQLEDIEKLHNETIIFEEDPFSSENLGIFEFIRYLKESVPPGRTFIIMQSDGYVTNHLSNVKMGYSRYMNPLDSVQEKFIPGAPRFLIPINDTSSIQVYGIGKETNERGMGWCEIETDFERRRQRQKVVIKVVSII